MCSLAFFPHLESSSPQSHPVLEIPRGGRRWRFRNAALDTESAALNCSPSLQPYTRAPQGPDEGSGAMGCHWRPGATPGPAMWSTQTRVHLSSGCICAAPLTQKHLCTLRLWILLLGSRDVRQAVIQWWIEMEPLSLTPTHSLGSHYESPFPQSPHPTGHLVAKPVVLPMGLGPFLSSMWCWGPDT